MPQASPLRVPREHPRNRGYGQAMARPSRLELMRGNEGVVSAVRSPEHIASC
jgi:hypothetical protein